MTETPPTQDQDPTKTLVYTGIAGLGFLLASFLGHIIITALWFMGWAFLAFVVVAFAARFIFLNDDGGGYWPQWVLIVCDKLKAIAARWPFGSPTHG